MTITLIDLDNHRLAVSGLDAEALDHLAAGLAGSGVRIVAERGAPALDVVGRMALGLRAAALLRLKREAESVADVGRYSFRRTNFRGRQR